MKTRKILRPLWRDNRVNHPRGVRFAGDRLYLSSIYDWRINEP